MSARTDEIGVWHRAVGLAARLHAGQMRKDGKTPYVAHPYRVAMIVREVFGCGDEVCLAAALLHDVIEDTPGDFDDVASCAGVETARVVAALTKDMRLPEAERERVYDETIAGGCWRTKLLKLADCYDNLLDHSGRADTTDPKKVIEKAQRAIRCAGGEKGPNGEVARAVERLRSLVARMGPAQTC